MPAKKTKEDYHNLAESRGYKWTGKTLVLTGEKTDWICPVGHEWSGTYNTLLQGSGCYLCGRERISESQRMKPEDYHDLAASKGFKWLGPEVMYARDDTKWMCGAGHIWVGSFNSLSTSENGRCRVCAQLVRSDSVRKKPCDYHDLAASKGFKWLGPEVNTAEEYTYWECDRGHRWQSSYHNISRESGRGCKKCGMMIVAQKLKLGDDMYYLAAKEKGFTWNGPPVSSVTKKTSWTCQLGHSWSVSYGALKGCPQCAIDKRAELKRLKDKDFYNVAKKSNLFWIGDGRPLSGDKTRWECRSCGNLFFATYDHVKFGQSCPKCSGFENGAKVSAPQKKLQSIIEIDGERGVINYKLGRYYIDLAFPRFNLAIEYDCWYWHNGNEQHDMKRNSWIVGQGWKVLQIRTKSIMPDIKEIVDSLNRLLSGRRVSWIQITTSEWGGK